MARSWMHTDDRWYLIRVELSEEGRQHFDSWTLPQWDAFTGPRVLASNKWTTSRQDVVCKVELDFLVQAPSLKQAYDALELIDFGYRVSRRDLWSGVVGDMHPILSKSLGERVYANEYVRDVLRAWRARQRAAERKAAKAREQPPSARHLWVKASDKWVVLDCHWTDSPMPATSEMPPRVVAWQSVGPNEAKLLVQVNTPKNVRDVLVHVNSPVWKETWCGAVGCLPLSESTWVEAAHYVEVLTQHHVLLQEQREKKEKVAEMNAEKTKHDLEAATSWVTLEDNWYLVQAEVQTGYTRCIRDQHEDALLMEPRILAATHSNEFLVQAPTYKEAEDVVLRLPYVSSVTAYHLSRPWVPSRQFDGLRAYVLSHADLTRLAYEELQHKKGKAPAATAPDAPKETQTGRGEEEETMANNQEEKSLVSKIVDEAKDSAVDAAWRTGGRQLVKLTQEPLVALLQRHLDLNDDSARVKIASFLSTDVGKALVGAVLSMGLAVVPGDEKLKAVTQRLARELRVESMALMGDLVAEVVMGPLRQVIALYLQDLGGVVEQVVPKELAAAPVAPHVPSHEEARVVDMPRRTKAQ
jgi:hypothetical protein